MSQLDTRPDFWRDRRVLVTGATGLVGGWLVEALLTAGARVAALVRDQDHRSHLYRSGAIGRVMVVNGDVADLVSVERALDELELPRLRWLDLPYALRRTPGAMRDRCA